MKFLTQTGNYFLIVQGVRGVTVIIYHKFFHNLEIFQMDGILIPYIEHRLV